MTSPTAGWQISVVAISQCLASSSRPDRLGWGPPIYFREHFSTRLESDLTTVSSADFEALKAKWSLYVPLVQHSPILRSAHTVCVLCGFENKQWLLPYTALTDRFL